MKNSEIQNFDLCPTCNGPCEVLESKWFDEYKSTHADLLKQAVDDETLELKEVLLDMYSQFKSNDSLSAVQICKYELEKRDWIPKDGK